MRSSKSDRSINAWKRELSRENRNPGNLSSPVPLCTTGELQDLTRNVRAPRSSPSYTCLHWSLRQLSRSYPGEERGQVATRCDDTKRTRSAQIPSDTVREIKKKVQDLNYFIKVVSSENTNFPKGHQHPGKVHPAHTRRLAARCGAASRKCDSAEPGRLSLSPRLLLGTYFCLLCNRPLPWLSYHVFPDLKILFNEWY